MNLVNIEEIPELIQNLSKRIDGLTYALLLAKICPQCGAKIKVENMEHMQSFICSCGLKHCLSNKAISNIKHGKDITTGE